MTIRAVFIGVNKHLDPGIPELSGARRDAIALWALFTDTIDGLIGQLMVDETASHIDVRKAVIGSLSTAMEDDVVVITFAGHGSPDGKTSAL